MSRFNVGSTDGKRSRKYLEYISSPAWYWKRHEKLKLVTSCERCGSQEQLEIHHRTYERLGDERMEDLEVCCNPCHFREHSCIGSLIDSVLKRLA